MKLIEITEQKYNIKIDLAYRKNNNFTKKKIYNHNKCFIHKDALPNLLSSIKVTKDFNRFNKSISKKNGIRILEGKNRMNLIGK